MKKLISVVLILLMLLSAMACAFAENTLTGYSDDQLKQLYEMVKEEMMKRGLPLAQEVTLREGKFIVGQDILPGTYTLKCTATSGDTYGDLYSSLGDAYSSFDSALGGLMGSLGGMMGDVINAEVEILGNYGTVLKSFEMKAGDSVRLTLEEGTALQISDGTCVLIAD